MALANPNQDHLTNKTADPQWLESQAELSLERLLPRLEARYATYASSNADEWENFCNRIKSNFSRLFRILIHLYGAQYDFFYYLEELLHILANSWIERSTDLKLLDAERENHPGWFQSNQMLGGVCYVDLFAGDLAGIVEKIPYFKELGLNYLHLMPLFRTPTPENDGGYAISSYRQVNPSLGTIDQLRYLARELRQERISLVLDFVFNHTSDESEWAQRAKTGDPAFQAYYRTFPDRSIPDVYEANLREIFPDEHPGSFTFSPEMRRWVWTTFHQYQWDLNYANPEVFNRMATEMLFLANLGVEVLRLDAVAFIWKQAGSNCENLPEAHQLIQAFNAITRIAAPGMVFKSEAIVHPDEVIQYISPQECQLSYNPLLMALLWNSLATREVRLLNLALRERQKIPAGCAWVNYVRSHDDIGWTFSDEDAARLGINGYDHRRFLNDFYIGRFPGSFARGLPFQENPKTGDARISGTAASLAGLEKAINEETEVEVELAIRRLLLIHAVILTANGIPLIYLGDEIGSLNDYRFRDNPARFSDSRWVHRPVIDWEKMSRRLEPGSIEGQIYQRLKGLIALRKAHPAFGGDELQVIETGNEHVLGYVRLADGERLILLANFSEAEQVVTGNQLRLYGLSYHFTDLNSGEQLGMGDLALSAYQFVCLKPDL